MKPAKLIAPFFIASIFLCAFALNINIAQAQTQVTNTDDSVRAQTTASEFRFSTLLAQRAKRRAGFSLMPESRNAGAGGSSFTITPMAASPPVVGGGSLGRLTKWIGFTSNSVIGNSTIFEDKLGMVGIGTDTPASRLTVMGMIESQGAGSGVKFPDGTVQTTSATGALFSIPHDATLTGNGTAGSPLGVAVPLSLTGAVPVFGAIVKISNSANGDGVEAIGGSSNSSPGGSGVIGVGGNSDSSGGGGGDGLIGRGGGSNSSFGGSGVDAVGGNSNLSNGGFGANVKGGDSNSSDAGTGILAKGGDSINAGGGDGVIARGGNTPSGFGGDGILASGGLGPLGDGLAGRFDGDVEVSGMLSKGGGSFKIDHPLDPGNRYLYHSFVESPDMKNIYDGVAKLDTNGEVVIEMPEWFGALNRDFRYLLTPMGAPMPGLYVAEELQDNRFRIAGGAPGMKISWQVTGIRQDAWAKKNRIRVEVEKSERERGLYLHPKAFDQLEELGIDWARNPEIMKQRKEAREKIKRLNQDR